MNPEFGKYGYIKLGNKYYEGKTKLGKPIMVEISIKKIREREQKAEKIAEALKNRVDAKKILMENLMTRLTPKDLDKLEKIVFSKKRKYKAKVRAHHCVDMTIGNFILPLVGG
jgi:hypothetical protein